MLARDLEFFVPKYLGIIYGSTYRNGVLVDTSEKQSIEKVMIGNKKMYFLSTFECPHDKIGRMTASKTFTSLKALYEEVR